MALKLEEIALTDNESKIRAINENLGQEARIKDKNRGLLHAVIKRKGADDKIYKIIITDSGEELQLRYDDLQKLVIVNKDKSSTTSPAY